MLPNNYWKKKLEELNNGTTSSKTTESGKNYWQTKMEELQASEKEKDIAPVRTSFSGDRESGGGGRTVAKKLLGEEETRDASFLDLTWNSAKRGYYSARYGEESYDAMGGKDNEKEKYAAILAEDDYNFAPGNWFEKAVSGASEQVGQWVRQYTNPNTLAMAGTAGGMAAITGQAGPQVVLPEEVITVPTAIVAGLAAGSLGSALKIEAGSAYNEMLEAGISEETARKIALGVGVVNAGLEAAQIDELVDAYKVLGKTDATKSVAKKIFKELADRGVDVLKETAQEVAQEGVTIAGVQMASKADTGEWAYDSDEVKGRLGETAKSSALTFGMLNLPAGAKNTVSIATEQRAANKLTDNEQKVVDHEYQKRIAEQEKDGKKLTGKQKTELYDKVLEDMDKGRISTDTIEEVLGGDTYKSYKDTIDSEDALKTEYEELGKKEHATLAEQKRFNELDEQIKKLGETSQREQLKKQLGEEVSALVKGDRLVESYNEKLRVYEDFKADFDKFKGTKHEDAARKTLENAVKAGANNTNKIRDFVEMTAQTSADTGLTFEFKSGKQIKEDFIARQTKLISELEALTNPTAEQLKKLESMKNTLAKVQSGEVTVNGDITENGIVLNLDSGKPLNRVVGHEVTHSFEQSKHYQELRDALFQYAKTKGVDVDSKLAELQSMYEGVQDANAEAELVADLVGDFLFSDGDFVRKLSAENQNVFQRLWNEVKYLCKVATAGSQEARELARVQKVFEDIYREEKNTAVSGVKNSLSAFEDGRRFVDVKADQQQFDDLDDKEKTKLAIGIIKKQFAGKTVGIDNPVFVNGRSAAEYGHPVKNITPDIRDAKMRASTELDNLIDAGTNFRTAPDGADGHVHPNATDDFEYFDVIFKVGDDYYEGVVNVENVAKGRLLKDITKIKNITQDISSSYGQNPKSTFLRDTSMRDISQNKPTVKHDYSLSDSDGKQLTTEQQEHFKDSKMRDENGNLKVMYHGSQNAGFHVFDASMSDDGTSLFFVDRNDVAASYSGTSETYTARTFKTADEMNSFFAETDNEDYHVAEEDGKFTLYYDGDDAIVTSDSLAEVYDEFCDFAGVGHGEGNYKVYLNLTDPLEVDAKGNNWNALPGISDKSMYDYIKIVEVGDAAGEVTIEYSMNGETVTETVDLYEKFPEGLATALSDMAPGESVEGIYANPATTREYAQYAKEQGYNGVIFKNVVDNGVYSDGTEGASTVAIAFDSNQVKSVANESPTGDPDIRYSLQRNAEQIAPTRDDVYGSEFGKKTAPEEAVAVSKTETTMLPDDLAPTPQSELYDLQNRQEELEGEMLKLSESGDYSGLEQITAEYSEVLGRIKELEGEVAEADADRINSYTDADVPPEVEAPYYADDAVTADDPFEKRDIAEVGNPKVKSYQYENPEVKPFFQAEAEAMLGELANTQKGERYYADVEYLNDSGYVGQGVWSGQKRFTSDDIAYLKDGGWGGKGYTYDEIEAGLKAIIEDHGAENNACSKRIEFILNDRLTNGYTVFYDGTQVPPNQDYINLLNEKQINEYSKEAFEQFLKNADDYAPPADDIGPVAETAPVQTAAEPYEAIRPKTKKEPSMARATPEEQAEMQTAKVLTEEPERAKRNIKLWDLAKNNLIDKGTVFETLSLKSGNRELQARWSATRRAESRAQRFLKNGNADTRPLMSIREEVENSGKTEGFYTYMLHLLNTDRMTLEERYGTENKPVFGYSVTAEMSAVEAAKLAKANPEFKKWAEEVYAYNKALRSLMVENGVISQETADLWDEQYPHYVPIRRAGKDGAAINVPLDTRRTGINAPIKKATGGNSDILPLFNTMADRTLQTFRSVARNRFGTELKATLGVETEESAASVDEVIDSVDNEEALLQEGKNGKNPTFTVFEDGKKVTFDVTKEMYDSLKPKSDIASYTNKVLRGANNLRRGLLTEYNPTFWFKNPIKDMQDVIMNSQHPARTYKAIPKAIMEIAQNGTYYQEYLDNGGDQDTEFEADTKEFVENKKLDTIKKWTGLAAISKANNFIEKVPRMAEYIASREMGRSVDVSMLDAARVTTDFSAGGDIVKMMNRNGFTFLNASVQGTAQAVRNVREARYEGAKGWAKLAAKTIVSGLPAVLLNTLLWDDDEEYEELSDYVKQNYYIVGKFDDGKFVRIPKGRTAAVIQEAFNQMGNLVTGDDEVDFEAFADLVVTNLLPNNPLDNNILSPVKDVLTNESWYGEDLVPTRLQDLPAAEQYDESTDSLSKWLGEKTNTSPYKWNYLLDQYSGGVGDMMLPMLTPEAESGNDSFLGNMIAPLKDMFTTDSVMNNQNVSDFYDTKDELSQNAKMQNATEEDLLMSKYMNSVNSELAGLYGLKRNIQNGELTREEAWSLIQMVNDSGVSGEERHNTIHDLQIGDLSDGTKYSLVRQIQSQIVDLTRESLNTYEDVKYETARDGEYANVGNRYFKQNDDGEWQKLSDEQVTKYKVTSAAGDSVYASDGKNHYRWYEPGEDSTAEPGWRKLTDEQVAKQKKVTNGLGISAEQYWSNKDEYDFAFESPENYAVAKSVGGYEAYKGYNKELNDISADKDANGKSITGSRKEKVLDYINNLDADYYTKIILWKSEYTSDDSYNEEIIEYLNGREDISYDEMVAILKKLGFTVKGDTVSW